MSASKEAYWDSHPCAVCGEAPSLLEHEVCERCYKVVQVVQ
jgi:NMD protein affecting ribosome stability and mRNA decay